MRLDYQPIYKTIKCSALTDEQLEACSALFSANYGEYSGKDKLEKQGKRIKLPVGYYRKMGENPNMYVSLCYNREQLLGHAFFLKKELANGEKCSWVTQLVVHYSYRKRGVATRLLQSAWGFSDYFAWGLATTNAVTVKTLESVTWREVDPIVIGSHLDEIGSLCDEIVFADKKNLRVDDKRSQIFTAFYPEFQKLKNSLTDVYVSRLGAIEDGCEWLAFTFQHQNMVFDEKHWEQMLDFSERQLQDAYSRMDMNVQGWTKYTPHEIDYVEQACNLDKTSFILDVGCGVGRHTLELAKRGYKYLTAYDFSPRLLQQAKSEAKKNGYKIDFENKDCRHLRRGGIYDAVICLYDVIGSFRSYDDNISIIKSIKGVLKRGGRCVVSVMNMEITEREAINIVNDVRKYPQALLKLKASNIMQSTGNVFNPNYYLLDTSSQLVYRKEQFEMDGELSSEYVIADYRFTRSQIGEAFEENGFKVLSAEYVKLGAWDKPLAKDDDAGKEILLVAEKV
jgi:2-polyprenyl-3-methyl-5-hydroxy-6-metoxy-1,4-benzoquinol methylase/GNAT superfamily N-acetyltransferase